MKKNLHNLGRYLALVVMIALALRPLVVSAQNASLPQPLAFSSHSPAPSWTGHAPQDRAFSKAGAFTPLRTLQKENQDPSPWGPCVSKPVVFHAVQAGLSPRSLQPSRSFLHTVQVLRI